MVRIYKDKLSGEYLVQTSCLDPAAFIADLSEAIAEMPVSAEDIYGVLQNAMPIAYKLSGYKADNVQEHRTLICGVASPSSADVVAAAGK